MVACIKLRAVKIFAIFLETWFYNVFLKLKFITTKLLFTLLKHAHWKAFEDVYLRPLKKQN